MEEIAISKFKATCLALLERIFRNGEPLLITKQGKPIAMVVPPPTPQAPAKKFGIMKKQTKILSDIVAPLENDADASDWDVLQ